MTNIYIKDYRQSVNLDTVDATYRYDRKYHYLPSSHADSIFNSENITKKIRDVNFQEVKQVVQSKKFDGTPQSLASHIESLTTVKAIACLIVLGYEFDNDSETWSYTPDSGEPLDEQHLEVKKSKKYVITSAQNNTVVDKKALKSLESYCKINDAELVVIPFRYRNPTTPSEALKDIWYDYDVIKYLVNQRFTILDKVVVFADVSTSPTAVNPLSGMDAMSKGMSAVFAHPQISLKALSTSRNDLPALLHTTGCITEMNYSQSKAGKKGEFHHTIGAIVIEQDDDLFHSRHVTMCDDGSFVDLGVEYSPDGSVNDCDIEALVLGDIHVGSHCPVNQKAVNEILANRNVKRVVLHDVFDGDSINHHEEHNPFSKFRKKFNHLGHELESVSRYLDNMAGKCDELVIVDSNHNDFLQRWIQRVDWRELTATEAKIYLALATKIVETGTGNIFSMVMEETTQSDNITFLQLDESYKVHEIELGMHGHKGAKGGRGSAKTFNNSGSKSITGHTHAPGIEKGNVSVGTSTKLFVGYNTGLNDWLNSHCFVYANGKRQLFHVIEGRYHS